MLKKHIKAIEAWKKKNEKHINRIEILFFEETEVSYQHFIVIVFNKLEKYDIDFEYKIARLEIKLNNSGYKRFEVFSVPKYLKKILYDTCDLRNNIYEEIEFKESKLNKKIITEEIIMEK